MKLQVFLFLFQITKNFVLFSPKNSLLWPIMILILELYMKRTKVLKYKSVEKSRNICLIFSQGGGAKIPPWLKSSIRHCSEPKTYSADVWTNTSNLWKLPRAPNKAVPEISTVVSLVILVTTVRRTITHPSKTRFS